MKRPFWRLLLGLAVIGTVLGACLIFVAFCLLAAVTLDPRQPPFFRVTAGLLLLCAVAHTLGTLLEAHGFKLGDD